MVKRWRSSLSQIETWVLKPVFAFAFAGELQLLVFGLGNWATHGGEAGKLKGFHAAAGLSRSFRAVFSGFSRVS